MTPKKAAIYCRVSTIYQADKDSLPVQEESLIAYTKQVLGIDEYELFTDAGYSGKNTDRPAYQDMMSRCRNHEFTHILVYKIDRISRNLLDFATMYDELKKLHIVFVSRNEQFDTSSAIGEAMLKIILIFAELERKMTSERVKGVMTARARKGLWNGARMPFGYDWDKEKEIPAINPTEAAVVRKMFDMLLAGDGVFRVSVYLNENKIPTKRGGRWTPTTVRHIATNPMFAGTLRYNYRSAGRGEIKPESEWIILEDALPAIISKEEFNQVQTRFKKPGPHEHRRKNYHPFSTLLYCSCGQHFISRKDRVRKRTGLCPSVYICAGVRHHWGCHELQPSDVTLLPFVITYIQNMMRVQIASPASASAMKGILLHNLSGVSDIKDIKAIYRAYTRSHPAAYEIPNSSPTIDLAAAERHKIKRALARLKDLYLYGDGILSPSDYADEKKKLENKLRSAPAPVSSTEDVVTDAISHASLQALLSADSMSYPEIMSYVDDKTIHNFLLRIINRITVAGRRVQSITFSNGVTHTFIY